MNGSASLPEVDEACVREFVAQVHEAAAAAFEGVAAPGLMSLVRLFPNNKPVAYRFAIGDIGPMVAQAVADARAGFNVYVEARTVRPGLGRTQRGTAADTVGVFALVIDDDGEKGKAGDSLLTPSLVVESSPGNRHLWHFLDRALSHAEAAALGTAMRASAAGGDTATGKPDQPYRVAGTPNMPDRRKRERGRVACSTAIIDASGTVFSAAEISASYPLSSAHQPEPDDAEKDARPIAELLERLSDKRRADLAQPVAKGGRSQHFAKVTGWLKGDGFTAAEAEALWRAFPEGAGFSKYGVRGDLERWTRDAWNKASDIPPDGFDATGINSGEASRRESADNRSTGEKPRLELEVVGVASFHGKPTPKREFLDARKLFPMRNVTLLTGDGGTGKSLLILQLALSVAGGLPWLGRPVKQGVVLYYSAEDDEDETHIRVKEICAAEGIDLSTIDDLGFAFMAGRDAVLAMETAKVGKLATTPLFAALARALAAARPRLLAIDNLADAFAGNENSRPLARQFIGYLRALAIKYDCAVVLLSHPSLSGINSGAGSSGSTAWSNSVRSRLYLQRVLQRDGERVIEDDPDARTLGTKKANYGRAGDELRLRWEDGRMVAVEEPRVDSADPLAATMKAERVFLHLLRWHLDKKVQVSPKLSRSYAPAIFAKHHQAEGLGARAFERAMMVLLDHGRILIEEHGPPSTRRSHLAFPTRPGAENENVEPPESEAA